MTHVFLGIPTYDGQICIGLAKALLAPSAKSAKLIDSISFSFHQSSLLCKSFNQLWCDAMNLRDRGITHFLLCHADIAPQDGFADILMREMNENEADVISAVSPLKSADGLTSTGLDLGEKVERFTLKAIHSMPHATFSAQNLMLNTGLMLVDLRKPWVEKMAFGMTDKIVKKDGKLVAVTIPEDWQFSRQARELGAKLFATRAVKLEHMGSANYPNHVAWGRLTVDEGCAL